MGEDTSRQTRRFTAAIRTDRKGARYDGKKNIRASFNGCECRFYVPVSNATRSAFRRYTRSPSQVSQERSVCPAYMYIISTLIVYNLFCYKKTFHAAGIKEIRHKRALTELSLLLSHSVDDSKYFCCIQYFRKHNFHFPLLVMKAEVTAGAGRNA